MQHTHRDTWFESLEQRIVLSSFSWTSEEVYLVELVNRARADPAAEAIRTGIDLTADLTAGELAKLVPSEPLALQSSLTLAARQHSRDMSDRNFFDHENPDGDRAQQRADANGYDGSAGENLAAGQPTIDAAHEAWLESVGHRKNVLSLWENFSQAFHYDEIGVGFFFPGPDVSDFDTYYTQVFGYSGRPPRTYILGVVYNDNDNDNFYSIGEGLADVRVDVTNADTGLFVGSYLTDGAGNYQIEVPGGNFVVTFINTLTGFGSRLTTSVTANTNIKIDATGDELTDPLAPSDNTAGTGAGIHGSATGNGSLTVTTLNNAGRPIAFAETLGGGWTVLDLQLFTGSPAITGQIQTLTDPTDGLTYAAATSDEGLLLFQKSADGVWSFRNLNTELSQAGLVVGDITIFISKGNKVHIAGLDATGDIQLFNQTGASGTDGFVWTTRNLSDTDLAFGGQTTPDFSGGLISYVTSWNALNIAGLDSNGDIQAVWYHVSLDRWRVDNLSDITGAPTLFSGLTAYLTTWKGINLVGTDALGNVSATWWVPSFGGDWVTSNLTSLNDGPQLQASSMTSFVTRWNATNIAGLDSSGRLTVYWWAPGLDEWSISVLSDVIVDAELPIGELSGLTVSSTGTINIFGAASDGGVLRYWWAPGGNWEIQNLTDLT